MPHGLLNEKASQQKLHTLSSNAYHLRATPKQWAHKFSPRTWIYPKFYGGVSRGLRRKCIHLSAVGDAYFDVRSIRTEPSATRDRIAVGQSRAVGDGPNSGSHSRRRDRRRRAAQRGQAEQNTGSVAHASARRAAGAGG